MRIDRLTQGSARSPATSFVARSLAATSFALFAALPLAALLSPTAAQAEETVDAAAIELFQRGRQLIKEGDWEGGCASIDASVKRVPAVSPLLNVALCREHEGRVATAWAVVERARVQNRETQSEKRRAELEASAAEISARLRPRLPRLRLVGAPGAQLRVTTASGELPLDTPVPLDPGAHTIVISAAGHSDARRELTLREGELLAVEVAPGPLLAQGAAEPNATQGSAAAQAAPAAPGATVTPEPDGATEVPAWVWISGGLGLALGAGAIGFAVDSANVAAAQEERCGTDLVCDEDLNYNPDDDNARKNRGLILAVALGVGGLGGLVASVSGLAIAFGSPAQGPAARVSVWGAPGTLGVEARGRF
jgi:hypothetical protein